MSLRQFRKRRFALLATVCAVVLVLAGCGSSSVGSGSDTKSFNVLLIADLSGPTSGAGKELLIGTKAAASWINDHGGVGGRNIVLKSEDSGGDPTKAVSLLQADLSGGDKPDLVIPSASSAEALAMVPLLTRNKVLSIGFGSNPALNDPKSYPYHFQSSLTAGNFLATAITPYLNKLGVHNLGVLVSQDEYGDGVAEGVKAVLEGTGITPKVYQFPPDEVNVTPSYSKMLASHPDAVFLDASGDPAVHLLAARVPAGGVNIPTIAGGGMGLSAGGPAKYGTAQANKNLMIFDYDVSIARPKSEQTEAYKAYIASLKAQGDTFQHDLSSSGLAWDQLRLIAAAGNEKGALDDLPDSMVKAIYNLDKPKDYWVTVQYHYTPKSHSPAPEPGDVLVVPSAPMEKGQYPRG